MSFVYLSKFTALLIASFHVRSGEYLTKMNVLLFLRC